MCIQKSRLPVRPGQLFRSIVIRGNLPRRVDVLIRLRWEERCDGGAGCSQNCPAKQLATFHSESSFVRTITIIAKAADGRRIFHRRDAEAQRQKYAISATQRS